MEDVKKDGIEYAQRLFSKEFAHEDKKTAYLNACKWLASNIISNRKELCEMTFKVYPIEGRSVPTFLLEVFVTLPETEVRERNCAICREMSRLFYVNGSAFDAHCGNCKMNGYVQRLDDMIKRKRVYYASRMREGLKR